MPRHLSPVTILAPAGPRPLSRKYYGRVVVSFHKQNRAQDPYGNVCDQLVVTQILPSTFDGDGFPGYEKVNITFSQLESILERGKRDWIGALESQKAVYLITDLHWRGRRCLLLR